jgi:hypothetical protein
MLNMINGLPSHVLLVHAVVILVPLAALLAVVGSVWPAARQYLGALTPLTALAGLVFVPLASNAGEWLQEHVPDTALVDRHAEMGGGLLVWAGLLFLITLSIWLLDLASKRAWRVPTPLLSRWVRPVGSVLLCAVAVVSVVQVFRIGDSGAKAAWEGRVNTHSGSGSRN